MAESTADQLASVIKRLQAQRQRHVEAIAEIDEMFGAYGIKTGRRRRRRGPGRPKGAKKKAKRKIHKKVAKKRGRKKVVKKAAKKKVAKKGRKVGKKKKRRSFRQTADEFVLGLLKGGKKLTTGEMNSRWKQARRGGNADNTLSKLVSDKKLKREKTKGGKGSTYRLA